MAPSLGLENDTAGALFGLTVTLIGGLEVALAPRLSVAFALSE
jgi:hypothetical protein